MKLGVVQTPWTLQSQTLNPGKSLDFQDPPVLTPKMRLCEEYIQGHDGHASLESGLELAGRARARGTGCGHSQGWRLALLARLDGAYPLGVGRSTLNCEVHSYILCKLANPSLSPHLKPQTKRDGRGAWPFVRGNLLISEICSMQPFLSTPNQSLCKHMGLAFERLWGSFIWQGPARRGRGEPGNSSSLGNSGLLPTLVFQLQLHLQGRWGQVGKEGSAGMPSLPPALPACPR